MYPRETVVAEKLFVLQVVELVLEKGTQKDICLAVDIEDGSGVGGFLRAGPLVLGNDVEMTVRLDEEPSEAAQFGQSVYLGLKGGQMGCGFRPFCHEIGLHGMKNGDVGNAASSFEVRFEVLYETEEFS